MAPSKSKEKREEKKEGKVEKAISSVRIGEGEQRSKEGKKMKDSPTQKQRKAAECK